MKKIFAVICLFALLGIWSTPSISSEFDESDILPTIRYMTFTQDAVGFISEKNKAYEVLAQENLKRWGKAIYDSSNEEIYYFIHDRITRKVVDVNAEQFKKRFPGITPIAGTHSASPYSSDLIGHTSSGAEYKLEMKYCGDGEEGVRKVLINNKTVRVRSPNNCSNVHSVEIAKDQLWLGTALDGEAGTRESEGVIVQNLKNSRVLARITSLHGPVDKIKADPFSKNVWVVTRSGIYEISPTFKILSANLYYPDFEPSTGEPRFYFSDKPIKNLSSANLLSAISRLLPKSDRRGFYEAVINKPKPRMGFKEFTLYNFFMGCSLAYSYYRVDPIILQPLLPFLVKANSGCANPGNPD